MKKILLLILTSLVLFACQKEDTELMENGFSVTQEYTCPNCGAKYSVTCKFPNFGGTGAVVHVGGDDWNLCPNPSWGDWAVTDESGQNVPYYQYKTCNKIYFICTCGEKSKEFKKDDFKTKTATVK